MCRRWVYSGNATPYRKQVRAIGPTAFPKNKRFVWQSAKNAGVKEFTVTISDGSQFTLIDGLYGDAIADAALVSPLPSPMATLEGFAVLPADTFSEGPPTGEGIAANDRTGPFPGVPVQGFSGVQFAPESDGSTFWFLSDNGFGSKANSRDYLLRLYQVNPDFVGSEAGTGTVEIQGFVQLRDPDNLIPWEIQNENSSDRLLTGADFDIESFVLDKEGNLWLGDEFGPYVLRFDLTGKLLEAPISTPNIVNPDINEQAIVIAHRGASGELPEHTLEAYARAIELGADFVEPDLVITKDGILIVRHEPLLDDTTNVAEVFGSERKSTKNLDGVEVTGYFAEDFTLAEIKQLRAVQPRSYRDQSFNGEFEIPTFQEVIELVQQIETESGKKVGIYPETKHPTFFDLQGLSLEEKLVQTLKKTGFTDERRIFIQSFEFQNLIELQAMLDAEGFGEIPLVQLYGDTTAAADPTDPFSAPYDIRYNIAQGNDLAAIYGQDFLEVAEVTLSENTVYGDLDDPEFLKFISRQYAEGVGPWKNNFLLREALDTPVDGNGDGIAEITTQLTGEVTSFVADAKTANLAVHPYTLRDEERFLTLNADGTPQTAEQEFIQLLQLGVDGFFTDFPGTGDRVRDQIIADEVRSPDHPDVIAGNAVANLGRSRGYEGMAISPDRKTLYPMLEGTVTGDPTGSLRIYEFNPTSSTFTDLVGLYQMELPTHAIGDLTVINDHEFLVIERDSDQGDEAEFKKIFKLDFSEVDEAGFIKKEELVDLLAISDPDDLNGDGLTNFNFPFVTIEDVLVLDEDSILVANDNNYPFSIGRGPDIDNNEIIQLKLSHPLKVDPRILPNAKIQGTQQQDTLTGSAKADYLLGLGEDDLLKGLAGNDVIDAGRDDDTLRGDRGEDLLLGRIGSDRLLGGAGDDTLQGGLGDDTLLGGLGNDMLIGGQGKDYFVLRQGVGQDVITDFHLKHDQIRLSGLALADLEITQGTGDRLNDTLIAIADTHELLVILNRIDVNAIVASIFRSL
jgi:glycerophosphoryl diester phosphodiesterase